MVSRRAGESDRGVNRSLPSAKGEKGTPITRKAEAKTLALEKIHA